MAGERHMQELEGLDDFDRNDKTLILHVGSTGVQDYKPTDSRYEKLKEILNHNN